MPFIYVEDLSEIMDKLKNHGIRTYGAHLKGINTYDHESYEAEVHLSSEMKETDDR